MLWLLTYGSCCASITQPMLEACGLELDECYTTAWRESKYTLIRLNRLRRVRRTAFVKIMRQLHELHGIIGTEIFGFEMASCSSQTTDESLFDHPGFKHIVHAMNKDISRLEVWMREGDVLTNRAGLLWKHIESTEPEKMTRAQLIKLVKEYDELKRVHAVTAAKLRAAETEYMGERTLNQQIVDMLSAKIRECGELQRELIRIRPREAK
jgi:hypothetical protein